MNSKTIRQLNRYNQQFYSQYGHSFARQREYFWPSWYQFVVQSRFLPTEHVVQVVDVGCGSARFSTFWQEVVSSPFSYTGIDVSTELLNVAHQQLASVEFPYHLYQSDIVEEIIQDRFSLPTSPHVVGLFGVLHHIPDQAVRQKLLLTLMNALPSHGELWLTIWNPERVGSRQPKEVQQLEDSGDVLLGWQHAREAERYVHWISEKEEAEMIQSLSQTVVVHRWTQNSPGERGNICLLLQKI